jgi:hypothetical protein
MPEMPEIIQHQQVASLTVKNDDIEPMSLFLKLNLAVKLKTLSELNHLDTGVEPRSPPNLPEEVVEIEAICRTPYLIFI